MDYPGLTSGLVRALALHFTLGAVGEAAERSQQLRGLARGALGHWWQSQGPQVACWWQLEGLQVRSGPTGPQQSGRSRLAPGAALLPQETPSARVIAAGWRVMQTRGSECRRALPLLT